MSQELGTYDIVPLSSVLSAVRMRLFMRDTTQDDMLLKDLIIGVLKRMRSPNMFIRASAYLDIINNESVLPAGFIKLEHFNPIRFVGQDGKTDGHWRGPQFINDTFFKCDPDSRCTFGLQGTVVEDNNVLFFSEDIGATRCKISYRSTNFDCDGELVIRADMEEPLICGTLWLYNLLIKDFTSAREWEKQFKQNKRAIKGIQNLPSALERKLSFYIMNSLN